MYIREDTMIMDDKGRVWSVEALSDSRHFGFEGPSVARTAGARAYVEVDSGGNVTFRAPVNTGPAEFVPGEVMSRSVGPVPLDRIFAEPYADANPTADRLP